MRAVLAIAALALVGAASSGCGGLHPDTGESEGQALAPIINGAPDPTDQAVVAVLHFNSDQSYTECTGTNIKMNGATGYVLTAAHCCPPAEPPQIIAFGSYYLPNAPGDPNVKYYNVTQYLAHPSYVQGGDANQPFDFCMITYAGDAGLPTLPAMTTANDNVQTGDTLLQVGYGQTVAAPPGMGGNNETKNSVNSQLLGLETMYQAVFSENPGGTCFGDSGGPDIATGSDGVRSVYGVHSNVAGNCNLNGQSVSGIISQAYDNFVVPYLNGTPTMEDCPSCIATAQSPAGACATATATCGNNPACGMLVDCANACNGSATCVNTCATQNSGGAADYQALLNCLCGTTVCDTPCMCTFSSATSSTTASSATVASSSTSVGAGGAGGAVEASSSSSSGVGAFSGVGGGGTGLTAATGTGGTHGGHHPAAQPVTNDDQGGCSTSSSSERVPAGAAVGVALAALALASRRRAR